MRKPRAIRKKVIDYDQAAQFIEAKLGYKLRDTLSTSEHFLLWCKRHGITPDGSSQEQWKQYEEAPDGMKLRPEYRDYWHFLIDKLDPQRGGTIIISTDLLETAAPWQAEITRAFIDEFGDGCEFLTDW